MQRHNQGDPRPVSPAGAAELSIVVPVRNEAPGLEAFFARLMPILKTIGSYEVICIDDGSTDASLAALLAQRRQDPAIKIISLSRNFGKDVALSAGLDFATGAAVIPIDADLQDPPEIIPQLVAKWREGFKIVNATRVARPGESQVKQGTAKLFYRILAHVTDIPIPPDTGDYRLLDRKVVDVLVSLPERARFMKGLFSWVGFKPGVVFYSREARHAGRTNWGYAKLWNFAIDGIASFSSLPLKIWSYVGLSISTFAFLYAVFLAVRKIAMGNNVPGYTSLMVVVLFLGGVQLITLGIVGEYLGRMYNEVKGRPLYVVNNIFGFDDGSAEAVEHADRSI